MSHKSTRNAKNGIINYYKSGLISHKDSRVVKKDGRNYKEIVYQGVERDELGNVRRVIKRQMVRL